MGTEAIHIGAILELGGGKRAAEEDTIDRNSPEQVRKRKNKSILLIRIQ